MNVSSWALWGFVATIVLTVIMSASQGSGITRMSAPYLVGTMFTPRRDRARLIGFFVHMLNGWIFSLLYVAAFHAWGGATWWRGAAIGFVHASFVLTAGMELMPSLHPRMASEHHGPEEARRLEPPGFLGLHYGVQTPLVILVAHLAFGAVLGAFYDPELATPFAS
jgi:hypothetical protein